MPKLFSALTGKTNNAATLFEIRLTKDVIVLQGDQDEAPSQILSGVVVLCLHQILKVESIYLKMSGQLKISFPDKKNNVDSDGNVHVEKCCEIFSHRWAPFVGTSGGGSSSSSSSSTSRGSILHPGNYEWPFELIIPGTMAESVHGLRETYILYKLKARVARGKLAHDLLAWKSVRIIRTLESADADLTHPLYVENVWPNKVEYSVMVPQKAVIFGTAVDVEMRFTILLKGLRIGEIKCQIVEIVELTPISSLRAEVKKCHTHERCIGTSIFHMTEQNYQEVISDTGQDGHVLIEKIPLPKTLTGCLQDCDVHGIKVRHKVKFFISLHNPDGHVSELRATIPITIFFSPSLPITVEGELVDRNLDATGSIDDSRHAPPLYGDHVLDQLYLNAFESGLTSPTIQSGMNTPMFSHSRTGSFENLASLDGTLSPYSTTNSAITPAALSSRLQNLSFGSRNSSFRRLTGLASSGSNTPHLYSNTEHEHAGMTDGYNRHDSYQSFTYRSNPLSRRGSRDIEPLNIAASGQRTPIYSEISEMGELNKVPSYRTAAMTPVRTITNDNLPNYDAVISAPPSPIRNFGNPSTPAAVTHSDPFQNINNLSSRITSSVEANSGEISAGLLALESTQFDVHDRRRFTIHSTRRRGAS
ncbi:putative HECT-type ubiquitin ligase-interacting protein creD [Golovinomyces cichoracearum]|uniref:Putative HECT-type ubiquitin ligase-interacting protein creD n=1 Tax=Golovinomyces cichoracearum TaxID=62708 RepID=A0A420H768_9PEZI|nr:putative HECT-type ubiquitin ligase-interacting protein creD [Golovinomyces cichoracearum]